jgi:hypothetical protein
MNNFAFNKSKSFHQFIQRNVCTNRFFQTRSIGPQCSVNRHCNSSSSISSRKLNEQNFAHLLQTKRGNYSLCNRKSNTDIKKINSSYIVINELRLFSQIFNVIIGQYLQNTDHHQQYRKRKIFMMF